MHRHYSQLSGDTAKMIHERQDNVTKKVAPPSCSKAGSFERNYLTSPETISGPLKGYRDAGGETLGIFKAGSGPPPVTDGLFPRQC